MEDWQNKESQISNKNLTLLLTFSVVATLSVLINMRVFYIVLYRQEESPGTTPSKNIFQLHSKTVYIIIIKFVSRQDLPIS